MWAPAGIGSFAEPIGTPHLYTFSPVLMSRAATLWPIAIFCVKTISRPSIRSRSPARTGETTMRTLSSRTMRNSFRNCPSACIKLSFLQVSLLLLRFRLEIRRIAIVDRLQVLTIKHKLPRHFKYFVRNLHHPHLGILGPFFKLRANSVNRVTHEDRFNEAQLVVSIAESVNIIVRHKAQAQAEYHGARNQALFEDPFFFGEDIVGDVGMHVEDDGIEQHAFPLRDRTANRTRTLAHFEVFV